VKIKMPVEKPSCRERSAGALPKKLIHMFRDFRQNPLGMRSRALFLALVAALFVYRRRPPQNA
jgi:hypothetical protein